MRSLIFSAALALAACSQQSGEQYLAEAQQQLEQGNRDAAVLQLKNALQQQPELAEARFLLGQLYLEQRQYEAASKELNRALEYGVEAAKVLPLLTQAYQKSGADVALSKISLKNRGLSVDKAAEVAYYKLQSLVRLEAEDDARGVLEEIKTYDTSSPFKPLSLVFAYLLDEQADLARTQAEQVLAQYPEFAEALLISANLALQSGDTDEATALYRRYHQQNPDDNTSTFVLARLLVDQGKTAEAEPLVDALLKISQKNPLLHQLKATVRAAEDDYAAALIHAEQALEQNAANPTMRVIAGFAAYQQQDFAKAHQHLSLVGSQLPDNHPALKILAASQLRLGLGVEAGDTLAQIDALSSQDAQLFSAAGYALIREGNLQQAKALVDKSAEISQSPEELLRLGILQLSLNDLDGLVNLEQAVAESADLPLARQTLATAYIANNDWQKANELAEQWQQENPQDHYPWLIKATVAFRQQRLNLADEFLQQAAALAPQQSTIVLAQADLALAQDQPQLALQRLSQVLADEPVNTAALGKWYLLQRQLGDSANGLQRLQQTLEANPDVAAVRLLTARVLLGEGQGEQALQILQQADGELQEEPLYLQLQGMALLASRQWQEAKQHYQNWLQQAPNQKQAVLGQAYILDRENQFQRGAELLAKALQSRLQDPQLQTLHTHFLLMSGDFADGQTAFNNLPDAIKEHPAGKGFLARIQAHQENYAAALENALVAYQASPDSRNVILALYCLEKLGRQEQGRQFLQQHAERIPNDVSSLMLLAERQISQSTEQAMQTYEQILQHTPDNFVVLNNLAYLYLQQGRLDDAQTYADHAVELNPQHPDALDTLAQIYVAREEYQQASEILGRAANQQNASDEVYVNYIEVLLLNQQPQLAERRMRERELQDPRAQAKLNQLRQQFSL